MTWAQRLKWVCGIEIETCEACGGRGRVSVSGYEEPARPGVTGQPTAPQKMRDKVPRRLIFGPESAI